MAKCVVCAAEYGEWVGDEVLDGGNVSEETKGGGGEGYTERCERIRARWRSLGDTRTFGGWQGVSLAFS